MTLARIALRQLQAPKRWALNGGPFGSKLVQKDYVESGVPVIRGGNLSSDSRFNGSEFVFVTEEKADDLLPNNAHPGDLVFTQRGTLGQIGIIPEASPLPRYVISQSQMKLTVDRQKADPSVIYYVFKAPETVQRIHNQAFSSGVPHINLEILRSFEIDIPELSIQRRIASILSAYDDLIDNNTRRIKVLENIAQMLYREWFVNFHFPGYEKVQMVVSELGPIPEQWRIQPLAEIYRTGSGGTPSRKVPSYFGGTIRWVKTQELQDCFIHETDEKITDDGLKNSSAKLHPPGTVLMAMYGATIGKLGLLATEATCNQACCAMNAKHPPFGSEYLFQTLLHRRTDILALRMGAAQQNISQEVIRAFPLLCPEPDVVGRFTRIVEPQMSLIGTLQAKNTNLRTTRDLLLPKLISGEIPVEAAAELVEQTA